MLLEPLLAAVERHWSEVGRGEPLGNRLVVNLHNRRQIGIGGDANHQSLSSVAAPGDDP